MAWMMLAALWWRLPAAVPYAPPLPGWSGRIITTPSIHVGLRPALDFGNGAGLTAQLSWL